MKYLLDTNICIYIINQKPPKVFRRFRKLQVGEIGVSAIVHSELQFGVFNSAYPAQNQQALKTFLAPLAILDFPQEAAELYGKIRAKLRREGKNIGPLDLLIAVHALYLKSTLVTNNTSEFKRIPGLKVVNWA